MAEAIDITIMPGETKASITLYSRETSLDEITAEIESNGIVNGLKWDELKQALKKYHESESRTFKFVFAETDEPQHLLQFGNKKLNLSKGNARVLENDLRSLFSAVSEGKDSADISEAIFVTKGKIFCREKVRGELKNIHGVQTSVTLSEKPFFQKYSNIDTREKNEWLEYTATCEGYVVITPKGELDILPPTFTNQDNMELHFILAPVTFGKKKLVDCFYASAEIKDDASAVKLPEKDKIASLLDAGKISNILVKKGTYPKQGKDAELSIKISVEKKPSEEGFFMNMKEFSSICEVAEGAVIAEKIPAVDGIAGKNLHGDAVPAEPVNDVDFQAGENVREQKEDGIIRYVAECNGILNLSNKGADISEMLQIKGDIGPETGNVSFSKSVSIGGDVLSGYRVECGGDLIIKGSVNDGAVIVCRKNMFVTKGVHGQSSEIVVKGDAEIGFIQDSKVMVTHKLTVLRSIYNSEVFCGGSLVVEGKGVSGETKGCVIGGQLIVMKSMELDTLGAGTNKTQLVCGINPEALNAVKAVKKSIASINKRTARLKREIGIDLSAPDAAKNLQKLPDIRKKTVKKLMLELREVAMEQQNFQEKLPLLQKKAWAPEPEECVISVKKRLFPDVDIRICNGRMAVTTESAGVRFVLRNGKVVIPEAES